MQACEKLCKLCVCEGVQEPLPVITFLETDAHKIQNIEILFVAGSERGVTCVLPRLLCWHCGLDLTHLAVMVSWIDAQRGFLMWINAKSHVVPLGSTRDGDEPG
jgi:hypothetical protein